MKGAKKILIAVVGLIACVQVAGCSPRGTGPGFFVIVKPSEAVHFLDVVESIFKDNGLTPSRGTSVNDAGGVLYVVEGTDVRVSLWVQNVVLSGSRDPQKCGVHEEPYPDPAQFKILGTARFFGSTEAAREAEKRVFDSLKLRGYDVRPESVVCGMSALSD